MFGWKSTKIEVIFNTSPREMIGVVLSFFFFSFLKKKKDIEMVKYCMRKIDACDQFCYSNETALRCPSKASK